MNYNMYVRNSKPCAHHMIHVEFMQLANVPYRNSQPEYSI